MTQKEKDLRKIIRLLERADALMYEHKYTLMVMNGCVCVHDGRPFLPTGGADQEGVLGMPTTRVRWDGGDW